MVKTNITPWQHEAVFVTLLTTRELSQKERLEMCKVYSKGSSPNGPYKSLTEFVSELENSDFPELANLIIFP